MSQVRAGGSAFFPALALVLGCSGAGSAPERSGVVRWVVVEKPAGEVFPGGRAGEACVLPSAPVLLLWPLTREDLAWNVELDPHDYFVEVLGIEPGPSLAPGEVVTATVRVARAKADEVYRVRASPSGPEVRILGARERRVRGDAPTTFRFTSSAAGRAGISIAAERVGASPAGAP